MAYLSIESFASGVDRSRPIHSAPSGVLWECINGHISRGGDVEKRKAFDQKHSVSANTFGLAATASGLYTFGSEAAGSVSVPAAITYQRLQHPTSLAMSKVLSWDLFDGSIYAIAKYGDNSIHHFFNGTRVTDWDGGGDLPFANGTIAKTHKRKMNSLAGSIRFFSMLDDATAWDSVADDGAGFQNLSTHNSGSSQLTGIGVYQEKLAMFARRVVQIWSVFNDDDTDTPFQIIEETGTLSPRSVRQFGNLDLFYLADTGIRSLRARDNTNAAGVQDVGTPIDRLVQSHIAGLTATQIEDAVAIIEPLDGRFWLALGSLIFVFSYFPSKKVSAWSWYQPGFEISDFVTLNDRLWCRSGNLVYLYGGTNNTSYDSAKVTVQLPFNTIRGKDGTFKSFEGMDIAAEGAWDCKWLVDPNNLDRKVHVGELEGVSYLGPKNPGDILTTHIAPLLTNEAAGAASLSNITLYHEAADNKG